MSHEWNISAPIRLLKCNQNAMHKTASKKRRLHSYQNLIKPQVFLKLPRIGSRNSGIPFSCIQSQKNWFSCKVPNLPETDLDKQVKTRWLSWICRRWACFQHIIIPAGALPAWALHCWGWSAALGVVKYKSGYLIITDRGAWEHEQQTSGVPAEHVPQCLWGRALVSDSPPCRNSAELVGVLVVALGFRWGRRPPRRDVDDGRGGECWFAMRHGTCATRVCASLRHYIPPTFRQASLKAAVRHERGWPVGSHTIKNTGEGELFSMQVGPCGSRFMQLSS
jgi:hypothetical protein